jgi:peptidoglycan L-alanyl-D-glutamate endopeptidase CwlK
MTHSLGIKSKFKLRGVHPDLVKVVERAIQITDIDFAVTEGLRTKERQRELVAKGASQTMNSRHITGHAVDLAALVGGSVRWDWPLYDKLGRAMKQAASDVGVRIVWGGDWVTLKDGPHFELDRKVYP